MPDPTQPQREQQPLCMSPSAEDNSREKALFSTSFSPSSTSIASFHRKHPISASPSSFVQTIPSTESMIVSQLHSFNAQLVTLQSNTDRTINGLQFDLKHIIERQRRAQGRQLAEERWYRQTLEQRLLSQQEEVDARFLGIRSELLHLHKCMRTIQQQQQQQQQKSGEPALMNPAQSASSLLLSDSVIVQRKVQPLQRLCIDQTHVQPFVIENEQGTSSELIQSASDHHAASSASPSSSSPSSSSAIALAAVARLEQEFNELSLIVRERMASLHAEQFRFQTAFTSLREFQQQLSERMQRLEAREQEHDSDTRALRTEWAALQKEQASKLHPFIESKSSAASAASWPPFSLSLDSNNELHKRSSASELEISSLPVADIVTETRTTPPLSLLEPSSLIPLNLYVSFQHLPTIQRDSHASTVNRPIAALFSGNAANFTYVSQTEWLANTLNPSFQQPLQFDFDASAASSYLKISLYDASDEQVKEEDRVGSVLLDARDLLLAIREREQQRERSRLGDADPAPIALRFAVAHEMPARQMLLKDTFMILEVEMETEGDIKAEQEDDDTLGIGVEPQADQEQIGQVADADVRNGQNRLISPEPCVSSILELRVAAQNLPSPIVASASSLSSPHSRFLLNPIAALFCKRFRQSEFQYSSQTELVRGNHSPTFVQPLTLSLSATDDPSQTFIRLSIYSVKTRSGADESIQNRSKRQEESGREPRELLDDQGEADAEGIEVKEEDRCGSYTCCLHTLLTHAASSTPVFETKLKHEEEKRQILLNHAVTTLTLEVACYETSEGEGNGEEEGAWS